MKNSPAPHTPIKSRARPNAQMIDVQAADGSNRIDDGHIAPNRELFPIAESEDEQLNASMDLGVEAVDENISASCKEPSTSGVQPSTSDAQPSTSDAQPSTSEV